ncbi:helix-turn-helix transcriptional regulator [Leptolyngbya sp. FACHB-16]|uniref:helix-turn-helix domain-containing protein n=1 Tax=unclassified Leptolyngbya TaxID=2650499 RepID=UPI00168255B6|nr:helix-turn-helix transcriptional regulator [Leptolyngbya sp. FACHB-16]MBD2153108.1 helix-turn-helix transcriptional regulator [Leptolyngbya sp. FACHB-16]
MPYYPSKRHWDLFDLYQEICAPVAPQTFLARWEVSYTELARLTETSRSTVGHWFATQGRSHRQPSILVCRRLAEVDLLWRYGDRLPPQLIAQWKSQQRWS